ncbi:unnamed protein product [Owenia fusiformis]|uniref:Uncharacterized protein n=1 Tax=Owenia fusiformis TaxID=6347 RepID=A0A8S4PWH7_OWEFU|nr:unnamed protein product [Owenia fusiformis]
MFLIAFCMLAQLIRLGKCGGTEDPPPFLWHARDSLRGVQGSEMSELLQSLKTDGEESCASEMSPYIPNVKVAEHCTALFTVQQIKCKAPMSMCKGCNKNTHSYCVQQYVKNWLPVFCNGGISWNYHEVPSGCACFKLPGKKASGKGSKGGASASKDV